MKNLARDKSGSIALVFSFLIFPLLAITALAVDYSNMVRHKTDVMSALDASALAAGRLIQDEPSATGNPTRVRDYAQRIFYANLNTLSPSSVNFNSSLTTNRITVDASFNYNPLMMGYVGELLGKPVNTSIRLSSTVFSQTFQ